MKIMIYFFLFFLSFKVNSNNLNNKLINFLTKEYSFSEENLNILVRTPNKNMYCEKPFFTLISKSHNIGLIDVLLTCKKKHYYLKVELQAQGEYIVANRLIPRGTKIKESDLKILTGRLDILPNNSYFKKKDIINRVNSRDILPLEPITSSMTHPFWVVKVNQCVTVIIQSSNFSIFYKAKSLCNAAINEHIRVKTKNGTIVDGIVNDKGDVVISI